MADKKFVVLSYICAFVSVYFFFLAYTFFSAYLNETKEEVMLPQSAAMNSTITAISSLPNWTDIAIMLSIATIMLGVVFSVFSSFAMKRALKGGK